MSPPPPSLPGKNYKIILMSARDKFGLGYGDYRYSGILSYENEVFQSVFRCNESDFENLPLHKRIAKTGEMQAVPPPMTENYLPSGPDIEIDNPHRNLQNKGIIDSGCSRHMTGNKAYLADFQDFNGGPVAFGGSKGYITGKGKIKTGKLDFEDVSFVKELQPFNLFSVSQMCDKKNKVLLLIVCLVLSPDFKLPDENQILLKVPRQNNMYSFNLENIVPLGGLACLIAKATTDESNLWHRRLGHVNFKNLNRLVKGNLVRGLPTKLFQNDHTWGLGLKIEIGVQDLSLDHRFGCSKQHMDGNRALGRTLWKSYLNGFRFVQNNFLRGMLADGDVVIG
ncbi:ribonuclease H-like domain-containing protein [Tanacetum coccineum]